MPHLIVEYSSNLDPHLDLAGLTQRLHRAAIDTGVFPLGGARTRAVRRDHYVVADGDPANGFVHLVARIGHGRSKEVKKRAGDALFSALCGHLESLYQSSPLAISFEIQEIDPDFSYKRNNLHERLAS